MEGFRRLAGIICTTLVLIFAVIHLGVSSGIIGRFRRYGDVFRPEIGLSAFNIIISIYALLIGGFGLFSVLTRRGNLSRFVGYMTSILALVVLVSLITALIINSLAINYVNSRFLDHMSSYENSQHSRDIINNIQTKYDCCGSSTWLDWTIVSLNASTSTTTTASVTNTTATVNTNITTTTIVNNITTTALLNGTTNTTSSSRSVRAINDIETFDNTIESSLIENDAGSELLENNVKTADTNLSPSKETNDDSDLPQNSLQETIRRRRQTQSNYGDIYGLPSTFSVTLPQSCCTNDLSAINSLSNLYCISNDNTIQNSFHSNGCVREVGKHSVGQTLGLAVINSILFILALATMFVLIDRDSSRNSLQGEPMNQPAYQYGQQYGGYNGAPFYTGMAYNTNNPVYGGGYF